MTGFRLHFLRMTEDIRLSVAFATRLPVGRPGDDPSAVSRALRLAPIAGLLVALLAASVLSVAETLGLPPLAGALLTLLVVFWFTGGLHEDGLADFADGLGARGERRRRLEVMRDSRVGTFGTVAIVASFGLRAAALSEIASAATLLSALIAAHAFSRALFTPAMLLLTPARPDGLSGVLAKPRGADALLSLVLGLAVVLAARGVSEGLLLVLLGLPAGGALLLIARWKLGGYTGDVLGAMQQVVEIMFLLSMASLA
jgi:adenosylcobinamide-GDP ribazoletransferase